MAATWPTGIKSFTTKNAGDTIQPAHMNDVQDEITALQTSFINGQFRVSAYNAGTQSIPDTTATALTFANEDFDTGALHDTGSNTSRVTVPASGAGAYLIIAGTAFAANATGYRALTLRKNGTTNVAATTEPTNSASIGTFLQVQTVLVLSVADYVEVLATQNSGGALNVGHATNRNEQSFLQMVRLW